MQKLVLLFITVILYANYVVIIQPKDYQKLKALNIKCVKHNYYYICNESEDKAKLRRFISFLKENRVNGKILEVLNRNLYNVYSIQVLSAKNLKDAEEVFDKYVKFPYTRLEKIGKYYAIRIGIFKNKNSAKELLKQVKKGFIRIADIKLNRIIKANFLINISKINKNNLDKKINKKKKIITFNISRLKQKCNYYIILSIIKKNSNINFLKNKWCYLYYKNLFEYSKSNYKKILMLKKALFFKQNINDLINFNYLKAKYFQSVDVKLLNSINVNKLSSEEYLKFLKTLLYAGDYKKIYTSCEKRKINMCKIIKDIFIGRNDININDKDILKFKKYILSIENYIKENKISLARINIDKLFYINENNILADILLLKLDIKNNNLKNVPIIYKKILKSGIKDNDLINLINEAKKREEICKIKSYLKNNEIKKAYDNIMSLIYKYPNDLEVNLLAGDILSKSNSYLAEKYYKKVYLLNKKVFFYHLLNIKDYKRLLKYKNELQKYPNILAKVDLYLANIEFKQKKYKKALQYALEAFKISPNRESAILLGKIYFFLKNYPKCIYYLKGLDNNGILTYYIGYSYYKLSNYKLAKQYFNKILNTKNSNLKKKLIGIYLKMGEKKEIVKLLNKII